MRDPAVSTADGDSRRANFVTRVFWQADQEQQDQPRLDAAPPPPLPLPEGATNERRLRIPLAGAEPQQIELLPETEGKLSLIVRDAPLNEVLAALATQQGINIVTAEDVTGKITVTLRDVTFENALSALTAVGGFTWTQKNDIVMVTSMGAKATTGPLAQGRVFQVFNLNFISATDVQTVAQGLLSPAGQIFTTLATPDDIRKTHDVVVVEDLPEYVERVGNYIAQVDVPPRQVLIEAHVLQVSLKDDSRSGVNWKVLAEVAGADLTFKTVGFANPAASPAAMFSIDGTDLDALLEALKSTTDSKTLAQPRVLALNGQEARIQIGSKLGFLVTTTTQTSTLQNVNFLNVGVLLTVRPQISDDQHVLLYVKPEVSTGAINPTTNLPEQNTTEVETTIMLADGQGIVIGGLIKEQDIDQQTKVPLLGDMWLVGKLFQKHTLLRQRDEVIVALIPRIVPYTPEFAAKDMVDYDRAMTPLLQGPLLHNYRPWEPKLPDAINNPRHLQARRVPELFLNLNDVYPRTPDYYFPCASEGMNP